MIEGRIITGHFVDADLPFVDGVVRLARAYRAHMQRRLGPSWIVGPRHPDGAPMDDQTLRYPSIPFRPPYRIGLPALEPGLRKRLDAVGFDVVHSHSPHMAGDLALATARRRGVPCVFSMHTRLPTWVHHQYRENPAWVGIRAGFGGFRAGLGLGQSRCKVGVWLAHDRRSHAGIMLSTGWS